jgi:hypothetical protein
LLYGIIPNWEILNEQGKVIKKINTKEKEIFDHLVSNIGESLNEANQE